MPDPELLVPTNSRIALTLRRVKEEDATIIATRTPDQAHRDRDCPAGPVNSRRSADAEIEPESTEGETTL